MDFPQLKQLEGVLSPTKQFGPFKDHVRIVHLKTQKVSAL